MKLCACAVTAVNNSTTEKTAAIHHVLLLFIAVLLFLAAPEGGPVQLNASGGGTFRGGNGSSERRGNSIPAFLLLRPRDMAERFFSEARQPKLLAKQRTEFGPMRFGYRWLPWPRCRGHGQRRTGMEHEVSGVRNLVLSELSWRTAATPRLGTEECLRKATPPIRCTRSPAHLLPGQPETGRRPKARKEREASGAFS
jgi:hypothetical protein